MMTLCKVLTLMILVHFTRALDLTEVYKWKEMEFDWPSDKIKEEAMKDGSYVPGNSFPSSFAIWKDKMFFSLPRFKSGVPATLGYIKVKSESSPEIIPYPSWEANKLPAETINSTNEFINETAITNIDNDTLIFVFRIWVDECDRLWVMDIGRTNLVDNVQIYTKPSILIYDLKTDKLIRRYAIDSYIKEKIMVGNIIVDDDPKKCEDAFAYIADFGGSKLHVYSFKDNHGWRIKHHYFHFNPLMGQYDIQGVSFQWKDGIFGLALTKPETDGSRKLIFHAVSSSNEFEVSTKLLHNETASLDPNNFHDFKLLGDRGEKSQATTSFFDKENGVLYYTQIQRNGLGCWNIKNKLTPESSKLFEEDATKLEFPADLKIDSEGTMWVLSNKLSRFVYQTLNKDDVNFRIMKVAVKETLSECN